MKKIIACIGSRRGIESNTYKFTKSVLDFVSANYDSAYEIIKPEDFTIDECEGCQICFKEGYCIKDDDMKVIGDKLLEADFIVLASPVYVHNISSDLKKLIDRLGYWTHLLKFAGKGSAVLSTNMSNGHNTALNYLEMVLTSLGSQVVTKYNASSHYPDQLYDHKWLKAASNIIGYSIIDCLEQGVKFTAKLDSLFITLKEMMLKYKEHNINYGEWFYWEKMGYLDCENFQELLELHNRSVCK
ncbi:Iron-sulfur flavoprotein AF_1436 Isf-1 [Proteiniborus sp. DW1]|uniref:flavodoxin family protein n=1 Tax=Proteiniborus sp. DW1 TaxID=1889883 RepID=UPI00092E0491|nr:flavodoxin family protein [Proteiniborus sp. DW1]SCG83745.1 Iron-sulfur flavoprotein AF_1436 Isf-1 [Proteiniborus sp. DW1]